jgi:phosphorylase/glycogen(starch) synthase
MTTKNVKDPDYIFEVSWEVCNKVGGIHTVVATKALTLVEQFKDNYFVIGPDVWKETQDNPEFIEDKTLYKAWKEWAAADGLNFRIGRWNIKGKPIAILIDFTPYFPLKDKIFADFWMKYQLDSISGHWDYVEPALFGYASALIIESFYKYNVNAQDKIVAQYHEWMTGTGILYLKDKVPQVGGIFTTHATVLGRSIAGNSMPLYQDLNVYQPDTLSNNLGVRAKHSLEKIAANIADAFTTVSQLTVRECSYFLGKEVDVVTPNGFEDSFVPDDAQFNKARTKAREKLIRVAKAVTGQAIDKDSMLIINSGRYEFRNKGIDLFIDSLWKLNQKKDLGKKVVAFITIPANQTGPRHDVLQRMKNENGLSPLSDEFLTHDLFDPDFDLILNRIKRNGMHNNDADQVKIIFVPAYLNKNDAIFNMDYYDLLIGFDMSVFPSYYEPWGYTPLESLAFHIPTVTTSLTGFGLWMKKFAGENSKSLYVVERNEENTVAVIDQITNILSDFTLFTPDQIATAREVAFQLSGQAKWENMITEYYKAYAIALEKVMSRSYLFKTKQNIELYSVHDTVKSNQPVWKKLLVRPSLPEQLSGLNRIARNYWWCWNDDAREVFASIDPELWQEADMNPVRLIEMLTFDQLKRLALDKKFLDRLEAVAKRFDAYMAEAAHMSKRKVAYFSMEFGIDHTLKIYSGGLGVLAGDFLKQASDSNFNIIGVGLLYKYGYFKQEISMLGDQISHTIPQQFGHLSISPVRNENDEWITVSLALPGRVLYAKVWKAEIGRIPLYLLDTDIEENMESDRTITHQLYGGDWENRFKQELLIGVGGIRLLDAIGVNPDIYHCNEGHAAFIGLERLRKFVQNEKLTFEQAQEVVRGTTLFTTHTPVPAGHDAFSEDIIRAYIPHYADRLGISWETFMNLGRFVENKPDEKFSMSVLAVKLSQEVNGVSRIHGNVTREMFRGLFPGYFPQESHIGYVTNGVHLPTWTAKKWLKLYQDVFGEDFYNDQSNTAHWKKIHDVPDRTIWEIRNELRKELIDYLKVRLTKEMTHRQESPAFILKVMESLETDALTIGFARRFATYKRAHLLFSNLEYLAQLLNHPKKPIRLIFAGKAHPHDKAGQDLIRKIIDVSRRPEFMGKVIFVENYDMNLARKLISGVDIWLNTPTRPLEASGTSGEKAIMNGIVNLSVLDGWWAEGYKPGAGWALQEKRTYTNQGLQDELDAETIYDVLEEEICPTFYKLNNEGLPSEWILYIKNTISEIAPHFTMKRMLDEYQEKYYSKLFVRSSMLQAGNFDKAKKIAAWKKKVANAFENLEVVSLKIPDSSYRPLNLGENFQAEIVLNIADLDQEDIGIEVLIGMMEDGEVSKIIRCEEMQMVHFDKNLATFVSEIPAVKSGVYDYAFRIRPKNPNLPHRQDFNLIKWI